MIRTFSSKGYNIVHVSIPKNNHFPLHLMIIGQGENACFWGWKHVLFCTLMEKIGSVSVKKIKSSSGNSKINKNQPIH
jgi:hypothetical protein